MGLEKVDPGMVAPEQLHWGGGGPHRVPTRFEP